MSQIREKIPMKNPSLKAFTFIEMIMVIAILVILATMLVFAFKGVRDKALRASCANNMSQIIRALNLYLEDYPVDRPPGSSINDIYGRLYYLSKDGKIGGITIMNVYVCPATKHIPLIPLGYGKSLKSNWLPDNGRTNMTDYIIIRPETDPQYSNFRKTPKGNAVLWEDFLENHKSGRHVGFWDQRVRFIAASDNAMDYPINLDYSTGKLETESIHTMGKIGMYD
jgi:prepilin-type N-terminal cleavage/methylation domain-containing protein